MDEITIEDKKYVSSKRAAKMTGYAKDYIGQLCREGRVPARFIGRSWYVLEAAIQDHRFGNPAGESEEIVKSTPPPQKEKSTLSSTWESPRYETFSEEPLPSLNRLKSPEPVSENNDNDNQADYTHGQDNDPDVSQHIQDSWKAWFDRFDHAVPVADTASNPSSMPTPAMPRMESSAASGKSADTPETKENPEVNIPIHTVSRTSYKTPPVDLLPGHTKADDRVIETMPVPKKTLRGRAMRSIQTISILLALGAMALAAIGSGYLDKYEISINRGRVITGIRVYNK